MHEININPKWTFKEVIQNIEVIKSQVRDIITSFSYFELKEEVIFKKQLRDTIYSFHFEEWKKDKIFEFIYEDIQLETLKKMI